MFVIILLYYIGKAFDNIGDVQNAEYYYQLSINEKHDHLPVIINYSRFLAEQVRSLHKSYLFPYLKLTELHRCML